MTKKVTITLGNRLRRVLERERAGIPHPGTSTPKVMKSYLNALRSINELSEMAVLGCLYVGDKEKYRRSYMERYMVVHECHDENKRLAEALQLSDRISYYIEKDGRVAWIDLVVKIYNKGQLVPSLIFQIQFNSMDNGKPAHMFFENPPGR